MTIEMDVKKGFATLALVAFFLFVVWGFSDDFKTRWTYFATPKPKQCLLTYGYSDGVPFATRSSHVFVKEQPRVTVNPDGSYSVEYTESGGETSWVKAWSVDCTCGVAQ